MTLHEIFLPVHIAAGALAIVLGAVALFVRKGGAIHRRSGVLFVFAMLVMGFSASLLGFLKSPADTNVFAGFLTAYFVVTAWTTLQPTSSKTMWLSRAALLVPAIIAPSYVALGVKAFNRPSGFLNGAPFPMYFFLATILALAAVGDVRVLRSGLVGGAPRLRRHLWRMCFALFIAAGSFFSVPERVAKVLPAIMATAPMRALPIVLLFATMFYWLWRLRSRRAIDRLPMRERRIEAEANR